MPDNIELEDKQLESISGGNGQLHSLKTVNDEIVKIIGNRMKAKTPILVTSSIIDDLGSDSLDVVDILQSVEKTFNIDLQGQMISRNIKVDELSKIVLNSLSNKN